MKNSMPEMADTDNTKSEESQEWYKNYGFDMYPERRKKTKDPIQWGYFGMNERFGLRNMVICEKNVMEAAKNNPLVKLLIGALKKAGCPVSIRRNFACEKCDSYVTGGYDQEFNQIVICHNQKYSRKCPEVTMIHELIHMYDYCTGEIDFKNLEHLACSEIRAANLAHCSFLSSLFMAQSSPISIAKTHQYCVKMKAAQSMMVARNITFENAMEHILKVFDKCYNDLEPIGRRIRRGSSDAALAYREAIHLGFCNL